MTRFSYQKRAFCVVQFIELPFEGIDDYVCVPSTWVAAVRVTDQRAVVAYPKDEDPFDTRDRVKRRDIYNDKWRFYLATIKHESDTHGDAENWIATRNDYGPLVEEEPRITDTQSRFTLNKKLRSVNQSHSSESNENVRIPLPRTSTKRPALSEEMKQLDGKRFKLSKSAQSSSAVANDASAEPGCSRWGQSIIIQDNQSMECAQTKETAAASNGESSSSQRLNVTLQESIPMQEQQELDMPLMDVDTATVVFNDDKEVQPSSITERQLAKQLKPVQEPKISVASSMEMTCNDQELPTNDALNSLKISAHLYSQMKGARRLVPIQKTIEKTLRPMNISKILDIAAQNPSYDVAADDPRSVLQSDNHIASALQNLPSSSHERPSFVRRLAEHQSSQVQEQYLPHFNQNQYLSTNYDHFEHDLHSESSESENHYEHHLHSESSDSENDDDRPNSRTVWMEPSIRQNSTQPSNTMNPSSELPQQRQSQPNQQDSQRQPQRPEIRIDMSLKPKPNRKIPTHQVVTKETLSPILKKLLNSLRRALATTHYE